jgi:NADH-quinone oxidoreductase subunit M
LYSFFKITNLLCFEGGTSFFAAVAVIGVVDASLKLWGQSDLKKIVAYCTVQEMNLIFLLFLLGDSNSTTCGATFSVAHAFLSGLMFFLVDCVYRRCHTRSVFAVHGLLQQTPNLAIAIIVMCVLYAGLPGTLKFTCEASLLITLSEGGLTPVFIIIAAANVFGVIGFSKSWFNAIFGLPSKELDHPMLDLSWKESCIIVYIVGFFILSNGLALLVI